MADSRKYYYLKVKEDFFGSDALIILESMPDGFLYSNILLKLYLKSLGSDGKLMFKDRIPYNSEILSQVTRHSVGTVEKALRIFKELELIEVLDNGAIYMLDIQNYVGKSSTEADRKRSYRSQIEAEKTTHKLLDKTDKDKCPDISPPELEIELEIELELNKNILVQQVGQDCSNLVQSEEVLVQEPKKPKPNTKKNFETIYSIYPRKEGKAKAFEKYIKWITTGLEVFGKKEKLTNEEIYAAVLIYSREKEGQDRQFIQMCSTFFNKTIFEYVEKYRQGKESE